MTARLTADLLTLDIRSLARQGRLMPGTRCTVAWTTGNHKASIAVEAQPNAATLDYSTNGKHKRYDVPIAWTACHLGGSRPWWLCPRCGRRCAIVYGGAVFICRKCAALHYPIQHASNVDKAILRAEAIRRRLGWQPGIANPGNGKPKGMHWKTYVRLLAQHDRHANAACFWMAGKFGF